MKENSLNGKPVLLLGNGSLACSIAVCLAKAGHPVYFCTDDTEKAKAAVQAHASEMKPENKVIAEHITILSVLKFTADCELAIAVSEEDLATKKQGAARLEKHLLPAAVIAINTESIGLDEIQQAVVYPERVIGLNWTEPAHTTRFLEIIRNDQTSQAIIDKVHAWSQAWNKHSYIVDNYGVRSRLMSAMIREAFYLVENGYATVEDIDRACRNDAGYYLPFAGNCRYMDLMGPYAYGMVMKDLNPDLARDKELPRFFIDILEEGGLGIQNGKGLYQYTPEEVKHWRKLFSEFSYRIEEVIDKYPFNYQQNTSHF